MSNYTCLNFEVRENVAHITLNRPEAANALNLALAQELEEVSLRCNEGADVRAVLLTGTGKLFCAGGDLKSFAAQPPEELAAHLKRVTLYLHTAMNRFARMRAPVVMHSHTQPENIFMNTAGLLGIRAAPPNSGNSV